MRHALPFVLALLIGCALVACSRGEEGGQTFADAGLSFEYPEGWHVTGFSTTNSPPRLTVTSYPVPTDATEGDCGGLAAVELLPPDGALVLIIDYGEGRSFPARPSRFAIEKGQTFEYECFGRSTMFRFRLGRRDLQAHVAFGEKTSEDVREYALAVLASIAPHPQPREP